ncbi:ulp1 protease family, C-terminal catalytic domain-containing protein [Tanacetum coccineum]
MVMGPEHGGRTRGVGTNVGYKKGIKGYIRKKRTYHHRQEDYEEMENRVLQKVKVHTDNQRFLEEMWVEGGEELESDSVSTHEKVTCATATVFPIGDGLIHGKKLIKGHMKVSVIKVVDFHRRMELPVPDDEFPTLINAVKGFIQWPISAIARFKGLTKTPISGAPTKSVLPQHQKVPAIEQGKGKETAQEPTNKKKTLEEPSKHKMALAKIAEQTKAKERDEKRKAEYRKKLNDLKPAITLHRPKSVLDGYNRWMSRGKDCVEPYNLRVDKEVFRQAEDSYFAINPTDIIELLTNEKLELGILTCFEMSLYQLKGRSQQNKVGFLHPEMITPDVYGADKGVTLDYLARALEGYEFYVAPYLQGGHYVLFIICPKHGRGFILDSQKESVFHSDDNYVLAGLVDSVLGGSLKWELPTVNRQPGRWECGYYVMKWMHDFVLKYQNDNFPNTDPLVEDVRIQYLVVPGMDNEGIAIQVGLVTAYILRGLYLAGYGSLFTSDSSLFGIVGKRSREELLQLFPYVRCFKVGVAIEIVEVVGFLKGRARCYCIHF